MAKANRTCSVDDCTGTAVARSLCRSHYNRWHYAGHTTPASAVMDSCAQCGGSMPPRSVSGPPATYCSSECRGRSGSLAVLARMRERNRVAVWKCSAAGCDFEGIGRKKKWCELHRLEARRAQPRDNAARTCSETDCARSVRLACTAQTENVCRLPRSSSAMV